MDNGAPTLEVGFAIDTGGSFDSLARLDGLIDQATANAVAEFAKVEKASKGILDLGAATAKMTSFGNTVTKEAQSSARELSRVEKAGEALVRQLDRQASAFGKTKEEMRRMKVEAAAVAAEQKGLTELAQRLRSQETSLYDKEFAAMRRARQEVAALAEDRAVAAQRAAAATELEAKAVREAAFAYQMFESRAREGAKALREVEAAEKAAGRDAATAQLRAEADAAAKLAREQANLAATVRASHAAQEADAAAAERLRMSTDPLYAATKRLNDELAESTRLYHAGVTSQAEYGRQQQVLTGRVKAAAQEHQAMAAAGGRNADAMRNLAIQMPDVVQGLLTGQKPFSILINQGGQLVQVAMMAEGGLAAMAVAAGTLVLALSPLIVAAGVAWGAIKLFQNEVKDSKELTRYRDSLGLTHKEMLKLSDGVETAGGKIKQLADVTVTTGDVLSGVWQTVKDTAKPPVGDWSGFSKGAIDAFQKVLDAWGVASAGITAGINGTVNAAKVIWKNFADSVGDIFYQAANLAIEGMNKLVRGATAVLNGFIHGANKIPGVDIGDVAAPQVAPFANPYVGASSRDAAGAAAKAVSDGYRTAYADAKKADAAFWAQVGKNAKKSAEERMREEAAAIKANRTPLKPKVDRHAEQLAREAEAVEAQIKNLYALADAYQVSGAAALIAEARVKAESAAIKGRADVEAAVERQIRLAIAQRVSDAAKSAAGVQDQVAEQRSVNEMVAAGIVPAERAADLVRDRIADLPLLAAIEVAQQKGLAAETEKATDALRAQQSARAELKKASVTAQYQSAMFAGDDRLVELKEELRLVGATDAARVHALATLQATREAQRAQFDPTQAENYVKIQVAIADKQFELKEVQDSYNESLRATSDLFGLIDDSAQSLAQNMSSAFGRVGNAIGDALTSVTGYFAAQSRMQEEHDAAVISAGKDQARIDAANLAFATRSGQLQINTLMGITGAAKGLFKEHSAGYKAMEAAEKALTVLQIARTAIAVAEGAAQMFASLGPLGFPAVAAMLGVMASLGFAGGGKGGSKPAPANTGTGTTLGDSGAKSESIKRSIDALKEVDILTNTYAREMMASLRSIDNQIGGFASLLVRTGDINASAGVNTGFKSDATGKLLSKAPSALVLGAVGSLIGGPIGYLAGTAIGALTGVVKKIPIIGDIIGGIGSVLGSLFGSKTKVIASGLFGGPQSVGSVLNAGFDADYYSDVKKTKKFFGVSTGSKYNTQFGAADPALENQFTLILRSFNDAIAAAAGPLGESSAKVQARLNAFVVDIGKIDLQGLTGDEIQEKLTAVFGAAADKMASAAFPGFEKFQQVGEGAFDTLVRVATTVEQVTNSLGFLGSAAKTMSIEAKLGLADQFESVSAMSSAIMGYFEAFYSKEEQAAAKTAQLGRVFGSLGLAMPATMEGFRALVEAQNLTTAAGQATYATLLQLAPAFAELKSTMDGAKSAADVLSEQQDLQRQLLELMGNTAALRALDLAKLDPSNRALQSQIYAIQDAQEAAKAAEQLRDAWTSVGTSIMDEVKRIRGLTGTGGQTGFASLMGQFNGANAAARLGDQDAAKSLPGLSQALLKAAADAATSRQELDRVQAQTAASLETTFAMISKMTGSSGGSNAATLAAAATAVQATTAPATAEDDLLAEVKALRLEVIGLRSDNNAGHAATAGNTGAMKRTLENVTAASGGEAVTVASIAA